MCALCAHTMKTSLLHSDKTAIAVHVNVCVGVCENVSAGAELKMERQRTRN